MNKITKIGLLLAAMMLMLAIQPAFAQDAPALDTYTRDQIWSGAVECAFQARAQNDYTGLTVTVPQDGDQDYPCADVVALRDSKFSSFTIQDYSWLDTQSSYFNLGAAANVRVGPDANAKLRGQITPTDTPVVEVSARFTDGNGDVRLLIRAPGLFKSGWINNSDAKIDLNTPVEKPAGWTIEVSPNSLNNDAGGEPQDWQYELLYAPNGQPLTDLYRAGTDLLCHGRLLNGTDAHFVFACLENGVANPFVSHNGWYMRVEGGTRRYFPRWDVSWPSGAAVPGLAKVSIAGEYLILDSRNHKGLNVGFEPPYIYIGRGGQMRFFSQSDILSWPQADTVLNASVCPKEPVRINAAGDYNGDTMNYDAAVGDPNCPSFMIGINADTPAGVFEIVALPRDVQAQEVYYLRDQATFIMAPAEYTDADLKQWLTTNIGAILTDLNLLDRVNVHFTGVPGFSDGIMPLLDALPPLAG